MAHRLSGLRDLKHGSKAAQPNKMAEGQLNIITVLSHSPSAEDMKRHSMIIIHLFVHRKNTSFKKLICDAVWGHTVAESKLNVLLYMY